MDLKSGFVSNSIGVLGGPLVQLATGGKPSLRGLADPLGLFSSPKTPDTIAPTYTTTPANPSATPSPQAVAATNATDAAILEQQKRRAAGLNTVMSGASSDSGGSGVTNYG